jgi:F420-non-reducing hydrogenase iron-sulfur subunit
VERIPDSAEITMFVCANCARPGKEPTAAGRSRSVVPDFNLPARVQQVIVPCTGRLQPEHVLKAFEAGSSIVSVVACQEDNCHYAEGSRRCALRVDYIRSILKEIGLGEGRLLLLYLPGSASEDLALAAGKAIPSSTESLDARIAGLRARVMEAFLAHPPNPLRFYSSIVREDSSEKEPALSEGVCNE